MGSVKENKIIDFATWYSGMEREKVERAYQRYLREVKLKLYECSCGKLSNIPICKECFDKGFKRNLE